MALSSATGDPRVARLSITPVKGLALHHPPRIELSRWGAVGDRDFFLIDSHNRPVSIKSAGRLVRFLAVHDVQANRLILRSDAGVTWEEVIRLGEPVVCDFYGVREVAARVVQGPWSAPLSEAAGQPLRLAHAEEPGAGSDIHPVTLLSQASVAELERRSDVMSVDPSRFRMLIEFTGNDPHIEDTWTGKRMTVGTAMLAIGGPVLRCAAVTRNPKSGNRDLPTMKMIRSYRGIQDNELGRGVNFGVYADVLEGGEVRVGDVLRPS